MPEALKDKIIASTAENVSLIKSIPLQFHQRIESVALRSISQGGEGAKTLLEEIRHTGSVTEKGRILSLLIKHEKSRLQ